MHIRKLSRYLIALLCINLLAGVSIVPAAQIEAGLIESMVISRYDDFRPRVSTDRPIAPKEEEPEDYYSAGRLWTPSPVARARAEDYYSGGRPLSLLNGSQEFFLVVAWPVAILCVVNSLAFAVIVLRNRVSNMASNETL